MQKKLLAKGNYKELTLQQHLIDTEIAAIAIFKDRILDNWCRFFRVKDKERFLLLLRIAALFHDLGKANQEFQDMVVGKKEKQTLRHEWLSALILNCPNVRQWLAASKLNLDIDIITAAVLSHHLKAHPEQWGKPRQDVTEGYAVSLYLDADNLQIQNIFSRIGEVAKIADSLSFDFPQEWIAKDDFWEEIYWDTKDAADDFGDELENDSERRSLLLAVKAGLIAADSVASGIFRTRSSEQIVSWVDETLHKREPITSEEIEREILQQLKEKIQTRKNEPVEVFKLKDFQKKADLLGDLVLLLSACGSGKTLFAYKWFQGVVERYRIGHLIFLYPTRGTATEGFRDYLRLAPEIDASLLTGTALYELQEMAKNPEEPESISNKDYTTEQRLFALGYWNKRFFSATVDQFLSFLTHNYSSLCLLPVLTDSVVVIDEVHSFSKSMFDNLMSFLQHFDIPVLCMTATLPTNRREQLEDRGLRVFPTLEENRHLKDLREAEQHLRYDIQFCDRDLAEREVIKVCKNLQEQYRILWVVNTVNRCREISAKLADKFKDIENLKNIEVLTYHSRFTLRDRSNRHQATVKAFSHQDSLKSIKRAIAVTTQVCEMSLDLDADIIITELAPISSLVQRMGRGNRRFPSTRGSQFRAKILVYEPEGIKPYEDREIVAARSFINSVLGEASQAQLAEKLEQFSPKKERLADGGSSFVDGGYYAVSEPFRGDENDWTVNAVLKQDLPALQQLIDVDRQDKKPYDGYILPVPKHNSNFFVEEEHPTWLPKYLKVADDKFYCKKRGFGEWKQS